jgi:hypothetical protein
MDQVACNTEIIIHKNEYLVQLLNNMGDIEYVTRSKGAELVFSWVDTLLEKEKFDDIRKLLGMATTKGLPLAYVVCLLMATNTYREKCQPTRDLLVAGLFKKYDGYLVEGTTIQAFLVGLV